MEQKNKFIYILPVMFGFFIMGFCDLVGISVTYAKEQFQWTETQAGFLPSMVFLWFFILSVPTAMLMNRIGRKNTVLLSMLFTFAGMVLPFIDFSETSCYVAFALLGIGNTILQVSLNPLLANVVQGKGLTAFGWILFGCFRKLGADVPDLCRGYFDFLRLVVPDSDSEREGRRRNLLFSCNFKIAGR